MKHDSNKNYSMKRLISYIQSKAKQLKMCLLLLTFKQGDRVLVGKGKFQREMTVYINHNGVKCLKTDDGSESNGSLWFFLDGAWGGITKKL